MSRFSLPPDPVFWALNSSISFDWRLGPYDVEQSRAHARMLAAAGIITEADRDALLGGLDRVAEELDAGEFPFQESDEDIHMAVERRLTEIVGAVGGKLHTARSRNDQVATDMAMFTRAHALRAIQSLQDLQTVVLGVAEAHLDWAMPGYTHLQRAQPVYLSHHLLAYFWMFAARRAALRGGARRDERAAAGRGRAGRRELPDRPPDGGRGPRLRGGRAELDRRGLQPRLRARLPGRGGHLRDPSLAPGRRDRAVVLGGVRLLRGGGRLGLGSSIMPQKKNPDAAELLRAKAPRVVAHLAALHGVMHGLPLTYNKDMQEDKEHLFDAVDTLEMCLQAARGMLGGIEFKRERLSAAATDEMIAAVDVADMLVAPRRAVPAVARRSSPGSCARRSTPGARCPS